MFKKKEIFKKGLLERIEIRENEMNSLHFDFNHYFNAQ